MRTIRQPSSLILLALLSFPCPSIGADDDDDRPPPTQPSNQASARPALMLSPQRQSQSGLQTRALAAFSVGEEIQAYGRVVDISPLLGLRARHRAALSELAIAEAALKVAQASHDRLAKLHTESIVPTRELALAESQLAADRARRDEAARHVREVREEALQSFGEELFRLAVEAGPGLFEGLLNRSQVLVLVALPAGQSLPKNTRTASIAPAGERGKARPARLVAAAPRTEESTQGETWFFLADAAGLRAGMRLDAWIPRGGETARGVLLPLSAVVWRDGQAWAFVKAGADGFVRRPVGAHSERGEAWFVAQGFAPGEEVVVVGAQMLLSEEQRRDLPRDGDDD